MDRSTAPFEVGDEVVCVDESGVTKLKNGSTYIVKDIIRCSRCRRWYVGYASADCAIPDDRCLCGAPISTLAYSYAKSSRFRKTNPYQSSVSRELAERAVESIGDGQDMKPVKEKEVVQ